jgi:hypothetical protein
MNTYDPADSIVYVHMAPQADPWSVPLIETRRCNPLPTGYANQSPRTRLRSDARSVRMLSHHDRPHHDRRSARSGTAGNREHRDSGVASGQ